MKADIIVRVTSDCPINFPIVNEKVIKLLIDNDLDYACNNNPPTFPHGLDCEFLPLMHLNYVMKRQ